mgnify:CR=1 FL=1
MNAHRNARTTPYSRALIVERYAAGEPAGAIAAAFGISVRTVYKWLARYRSGGVAALETRRLAGYAADVFEMEDWALDNRPRRIDPLLLAHPNSVFTDLWVRLAEHYKSNPRVMFGLMNEPVGSNMTAQTWLASSQAAINARFYDNAVDTIICDDLMIVRENGQTTVSVQEGSILNSVLGGEAVETRNMNVVPVLVAYAVKGAVWCAMRRACRIAVRTAAYELVDAVAGGLIPDPPK